MLDSKELTKFITGYSTWSDWWTMKKYFYKTFHPTFYAICKIIYLKICIFKLKIQNIFDK